MRRTCSRIAGRLLTGPIAFLLAWVIDLTVYGLRALVGHLRRN